MSQRDVIAFIDSIVVVSSKEVGLVPLPKHLESAKSIPMRNLTATICLTLSILRGRAGTSASVDFQKGLSAYGRGD